MSELSLVKFFKKLQIFFYSQKSAGGKNCNKSPYDQNFGVRLTNRIDYEKIGMVGSPAKRTRILITQQTSFPFPQILYKNHPKKTQTNPCTMTKFQIMASF